MKAVRRKNLENVKRTFISVLSRPRFKFSLNETEFSIDLIYNSETFRIVFIAERERTTVWCASKDIKMVFRCAVANSNPQSQVKLALLLAKKISMKPVYDVVSQ